MVWVENIIGEIQAGQWCSSDAFGVENGGEHQGNCSGGPHLEMPSGPALAVHMAQSLPHIML